METEKIAGPLAGVLASAGFVLLLAAVSPPSEHLVEPPVAPAAAAEDAPARRHASLGLSSPEPQVVPAKDSQAPSPAEVSQDNRFVARPNETIEQIAARLYGRREIASLLVRAGLPENPLAGQPLEIPLAQEIPLPRGSSLSTLARAHYGDGKRWPVLAALSGIKDADRCKAGTRIILPAQLRVQIRAGDSLSKFSKLAWGSPRGGNLIALWNNLPADSWLTKGRWIEIPLPGPVAD